MSVNNSQTEKRCTICGRVKSLSEFVVNNKAQDGRRNQCRECRNEQKKRWYAENIEYAKAMNKAYYAENSERLKAMSKAHYARNVEHALAWAKAYRKKNPNHRRDWHLMRVYGITPDDYNALFLNQNGCCAICGIHQSELKKKLGIDHNHETGEIRGLLCIRCNTAIGLMGESVERFKGAIKYILAWQGGNVE